MTAGTNKNTLAACIVHQGSYVRGRRLARRAVALANAGHAVHVICRRSAAEAGADAGEVRVHEVGRGDAGGRAGDGAFLIAASLKLLILNLRHRFVVIEIDTPPSRLSLAALIPRLFTRGSSAPLRRVDHDHERDT